jgi:hypothetical protein
MTESGVVRAGGLGTVVASVPVNSHAAPRFVGMVGEAVMLQRETNHNNLVHIRVR